MRAMCQCGGRPLHHKTSRYSMCHDISLTSVPSVGQRTGVYSCLSPCDGCKDPAGWWCGWLKISKLAWGFFGSYSINGSQETSCINRKGFFIVFVLCPTEGTEVRLISWHIARILNPFTYYLNFPSASRIAQNPPRSTSLEFEQGRK